MVGKKRFRFTVEQLDFFDRDLDGFWFYDVQKCRRVYASSSKNACEFQSKAVQSHCNVDSST
jgi:hypothetical protein